MGGLGRTTTRFVQPVRRLSIDPTGGPLEVLCLGAHSDDIEIGSGGTILRLLAEHPGSTVRWVVFATAAERAQEADSGAALTLADAAVRTVQLLDFEDSYFPGQVREIKDVFEKLKTEVEPDVILTHTANDAHQDHRTISELTWNTFRNHLVLEYEIPKYDGDLGRPGLFVPLSRFQAERKIELLFDAFGSQKERHWFDPEVFRGLLRLRGVECRAADGYAEAFYCRKVVL
jgi:LmbE family N-acetylglucosaminyl deacetylase